MQMEYRGQFSDADMSRIWNNNRKRGYQSYGGYHYHWQVKKAS